MNQSGQSRNRPTNIWSTDFDKVPVPFNGSRKVFSTTGAETIGRPYAKQNHHNLNLHFIPYKKT